MQNICIIVQDISRVEKKSIVLMHRLPGLHPTAGHSCSNAPKESSSTKLKTMSDFKALNIIFILIKSCFKLALRLTWLKKYFSHRGRLLAVCRDREVVAHL